MAQQGYQLPPAEVVDIIDARPDPSVRFSPDTQWMMFVDRDAMPDISDVSRRMLQLAGMRIDPSANGTFSTSFSRGLTLKKKDSPEDADIRIPLPDDVKLSYVSWSHDSKHFCFVTVTESGQTLYRGSVDDPKNPQKLSENLNTVMGGFEWMPDGIQIVATLVPDDRGDEPTADPVPPGPNIQESAGNKSPTRTYQDLLQNPHDEALFEYYTTTQLALFDVAGKRKDLAVSGIIASFDISPSGDYLLTTTIQRPFSYLMTSRSFPRTVEVHKLSDAASGPKRKLVAEIPMAENIPIEGVRMGPRNISFRAGEPATLVWTEALDGGDPNVKVDFRDQLMMHKAPFDGPPQEMLKIQHRSYGMTYFENPYQLMTTEYDRDRRWVRSLLHDLQSPESEPKVMMDRSIRDRYGDPGRMIQKSDKTGYGIVRQDGDYVYLSGAGASPKGNLPFIDRQNLKTLKTERLWRCKEGTYESVVRVAESQADSKPKLVTLRESKTAPPNYFLRDLNQGDSAKPLTAFKDPTPQIRGIKKQRVTYERSDGVPLSATLYLPADYKEGTRLPLLVWAYPREFNDAKTAGQISGSTDNFTRMRGITHLTLLTQGYAIMDSATMPVIGDPETMNDTFIEQIVDAAEAAIDKAVEMGVADRERVAVGGHSYGAFMTANLLAHSDLFKAGVARSGAYNRTLTPFGFQSERRPYWQAKNIYHSISPFLHADKIDEPILLIHGENDNNSGTFPIQSQRMYQAIKGNGGTVRLCMLPYESHGYRARQSVLHTQAEMIAWLDEYVKNASSSEAKPE
ncbi:MAG: prolyl oligopeptidase family serine peptidase [Planctomycetota bacterium]